MKHTIKGILINPAPDFTGHCQLLGRNLGPHIAFSCLPTEALASLNLVFAVLCFLLIALTCSSCYDKIPQTGGL